MVNSLAEQGVLFEEDFILRNCTSVTSIPDISLTELVANSWDAGAFNVYITIPKEEGEIISIEDDGIGMTHEEFQQRWMTLNYNRQKRQGKKVEFPDDVEGYQRIAYGRSGIGRHGMFCFSDSYTVETWRDGKCHKYDIAISSGKRPFSITNHEVFIKAGHGTKLSAYVHRRLPKAEEMEEIISARFLYDPRFIVRINGKSLDLSQHKGIHERKNVKLDDGTELTITVIDSSKTAKKSQQHGIAFWVGGRLVGKPSWSYGDFVFLDGRVKTAKRYTIVIQTDDIREEVLPDWSGFADSLKMRSVFRQLKKHIDESLLSVMSEQIKDTQLTVIEEMRDQLEELHVYGQREVSLFIEEVTSKQPVISQDFLKTAIEAVINIEKSRRGEQLLSIIGKMSPDDIDKLTTLLKNWDINDILMVIDEIDRRIIVIEAISRLQDDKTVDELRTLHPLVLNARWLFGSQYDSPMFVSNSALSTVLKQLFNKSEQDKEYAEHLRRRPDIVVLKESTIKAVCTDRLDVESEIYKPDQILIIELKRGGFKITDKEFQQASYYTRQIRRSCVLHKKAEIHTFLVGSQIGDVDTYAKTDSGIIAVVTYGQLVETASQKLFRLRDSLKKHYDSLEDKSIVEQALGQYTQTKMTLNIGKQNNVPES